MKKIVAMMSALGALFASPIAALAYAQTDLSTSTANTIDDNFVAQTANIVYHNIPDILLIMAFLIGVGWAVRKFQKHASGRKF